jgi:iron complex outermembrane receptor protein
MKKTNVLTQDAANPGFSRPGGSARSKGVEFDLDAKLGSGFEVFATYAYTLAEWSTNASDPNFGFQIRVGDPLINVPKHQGNLLLFKNFLVGGRDAMIGGGVTYVDRRLGETATTFFLPSYTLARLTGSIELADNIKLSADVNNLFDKKYYASSYAALWVQPGAPRAYSARISFKF